MDRKSLDIALYAARRFTMRPDVPPLTFVPGFYRFLLRKLSRMLTVTERILFC